MEKSPSFLAAGVQAQLCHILSRVLVITGFVFLQSLLQVTPLLAQSDGLPRGARMPYTRYESEDGAWGGGAKLEQTATFAQTNIASEASNQKYVSLPSNGSYVSWKIKAAAQGLDLRFTMPDDTAGKGRNGSLDLYVNGEKIRTIKLSSYWAYQYFITGDPKPYQTPKEKVYMRFDEVHFKLNHVLNPGDILKIEKDNGDTLTYGVDFIELEPVPPVIKKPSGYLSVTDYGAVPNDNKDDLAAFDSCISDAAARDKNVYIPAGRFLLSDKLILDVSNMKITGAGIWQTRLYFSTNKQFYGGIYARASHVEISDFSMNTANNARFKYNEANSRVPGSPYKMYKGFAGTYGTGSFIHNVWIEHFECGFWIAGYDPPYPVDITQNLTIANCRIRNNYADGVNFCEGTSNSLVENCSFRNNGDDAMAVWPHNGPTVKQPCTNDVFHNNTVENNWRAGSAAIFGGYGHQIHHCVFKDGIAGSGIRFTNDFSGFTYDNNHTPTRIYENTIIHCGTSYDIWNQKRGAIELHGNTGIFNLQFDNNDIYDSQHNAIQMRGSNFYNLIFTNTRINGTGLDSVGENAQTDTSRSFGLSLALRSKTATFNKLTIRHAASGKYLNHDAGFRLIIEDKDIPVKNISLNFPHDTTLTEGQSLQLEAVFHPAGATDKIVTWTSSNPSAVSVDAFGRVRAIGNGSSVITATSKSARHTAHEIVTVVRGPNKNY